MLYTCRVLVPVQTHPRIVTIEGDSPEWAANEAHSRYFTNPTDSMHVARPARDHGEEDVYFARIDVAGYGTFTSRMFKSQIKRRGGVKLNAPTMKERLLYIAGMLEWKDDPAELIGTDMWIGEEEYAQ